MYLYCEEGGGSGSRDLAFRGVFFDLKSNRGSWGSRGRRRGGKRT